MCYFVVRIGNEDVLYYNNVEWLYVILFFCIGFSEESFLECDGL